MPEGGGGMSPFDFLMLSSGNPDLYAQQMAVERRRALASALLQGGVTGGMPTEIAGHPTGPLPFLVGGADRALGAYGLRRADQAQAALYGGLLRGPQSFQSNGPQPSNQPTAARAQSATQSGTGLGALQEPQQESPPAPTLQAAPPQQGGGFGQNMFGGPFGQMMAGSMNLSPDLKNALAASGGDWAGATQLMRAKLIKDGVLEFRPGQTGILPNGQIFTAPTDKGVQIIWDQQTGQPSMHLMGGAAETQSGLAYAEGAPKAALNVWEAQHTPKPITPGAGEVFATPAGGMAMPPGFSPPSGAPPMQSQLGAMSAPRTNASPSIFSHAPQSSSTPQLGEPRGLSMSPEGLAWQKGPGQQELQEVKDKGDAAQESHYQLQMLQNELGQLPGNGHFLTPGKGGEERLAIAKWVNSALVSQGMKPYFNPQDVATAEASLKTGGRMGLALSRSLGSREAAQIVQLSIQLNPGLGNTPQGNDLIMRSMNAAAQRDADRQQFFNDWMSKHGSTFNADTAFNQTHPITSYVGLATAPNKARAALKSNPSLAQQFDQKYGQGASDRVLRAPYGWQ